MHRLFLFGGISLERSSGPRSGLTIQRRPLALLAVLAATRSVGVSRDRLVGLFWPEYPETKARHSLANALYLLRKKLGDGAFLSGGDELRLNPDAVWCDVRAFHGALDRTDGTEASDREALLAEAVRFYRGPFLDGFYVPDAPEFEKWADAERRHLAAAFMGALEGLAEGSEDRADWPAAVNWWKQGAAHEPTNSRVAKRLMQACVAAGNIGGALQHARVHEQLLEETLGLGLPPEIRELAEHLARAGDPTRKSEVPHVEPDSSREPESRPALDKEGKPELERSTLRGGDSHEVMSASARPRGGESGVASVIPRVVAVPALLILLATGLFALVGEGRGRGEAAEILTDGSARSRSIAVLPFEYLGRDAEHSFLARALHEELITQLSKVATLTVIGRTSVMAYAEAPEPLTGMVSELGVGRVVEGGVQVVQGRLRVTVRLTDAATHENLWAERYDGELEDAFSIQADIARRVVAAVGAVSTDSERERMAAEPTSDPVAYRLYLHGNDYWNRPGRLQENWEAAQEMYERALALDPEFALARAALSQVNGWMHFVRYDPSPARLERQRQEAELAIRLEPTLPQAHIALGLWHYLGRGDYTDALREFSVALEGLPNDPWLWQLVAAIHRRRGDWESFFSSYQRAVRLDPLDADLIADLGGNTYSMLGRHADAVLAYDRALSIEPDLRRAAVGKGWTYVFWRGELDTLRAVAERLPNTADLRVQLLLLERDADALLELLSAAGLTVHSSQQFFRPPTLYAAWAHRLEGDDSAARHAFDSALAVVDSVIEESPDDWRVHVARGLSLAGLGRRDDARREADWLRQSAAYENDAMEGAFVAVQRALVLAQAGRAEEAVDELGRVLAGPTSLSHHMLRLDPLWDPIRTDPRFQHLVDQVRRSESTPPTRT